MDINSKLPDFKLNFIVDTTELCDFIALPKNERLRQLRCFFIHSDFTCKTIAILTGIDQLLTGSAHKLADFLIGREGFLHEKQVIAAYLILRYHPENVEKFCHENTTDDFTNILNKDGSIKAGQCPKLDLPWGMCNCFGYRKRALFENDLNLAERRFRYNQTKRKEPTKKKGTNNDKRKYKFAPPKVVPKINESSNLVNSASIQNRCFQSDHKNQEPQTKFQEITTPKKQTRSAHKNLETFPQTEQMFGLNFLADRADISLRRDSEISKAVKIRLRETILNRNKEVDQVSGIPFQVKVCSTIPLQTNNDEIANQWPTKSMESPTGRNYEKSQFSFSESSSQPSTSFHSPWNVVQPECKFNTHEVSNSTAFPIAAFPTSNLAQQTNFSPLQNDTFPFLNPTYQQIGIIPQSDGNRFQILRGITPNAGVHGNCDTEFQRSASDYQTRDSNPDMQIRLLQVDSDSIKSEKSAFQPYAPAIKTSNALSFSSEQPISGINTSKCSKEIDMDN